MNKDAKFVIVVGTLCFAFLCSFIAFALYIPKASRQIIINKPSPELQQANKDMGWVLGYQLFKNWRRHGE